MEKPLEKLYAYAITWSPMPLYKVHSPVKQFKIYIKMLCSWGIFESLNLALVPEVNKQGNIHFHGAYNIVDTVKWYKTILPNLKNQGYIVIKEILNDGWDKYIRKDNRHMQDMLNIKLPLLRNPFKKEVVKCVSSSIYKRNWYNFKNVKCV